MHDVRKQDELVTAVLSRASNARDLVVVHAIDVPAFAAEVGDPQDVDGQADYSGLPHRR